MKELQIHQHNPVAGVHLYRGKFSYNAVQEQKETEFEMVMRHARSMCYMTFPVQRVVFQPDLWKSLLNDIELQVGSIRHKRELKKKLPPAKLQAVKNLLTNLYPRYKYFPWK